MNDLIINTTDITLKNALKLLSKSGQKCLVISNKNNKLIGTLSDGDIRKAIVSNRSLNSKINKIFQKKPVFLISGKYTNQKARKLFLDEKFDIIPVVDTNNKIVDILYWDKVFKNNNSINKTNKEKHNIPVVIMAGGKGTRLEPFSEVLPKPLIPINGKTIVERIIEKFHLNGFRKYNFIINYKSLILKAYFQEIKKKYNINFFEEKKPLGTIGGLYLIKDKIPKNFFVSNCDVIITTDYLDLYNYHLENNNDITLVVTTKEYVMPYGDCKIDKNGNLKKIIEKPKFDFLINSGLYVFNNSVIKLIKANEYLDINNLLNLAKMKQYKIGVYPIHEDSWIDVGQWSEYKNSIERL
tara:strand:- start:1251 stop:2312 length:1062 start_codon:yes stop_codon:yes gene_type:complete